MSFSAQIASFSKVTQDNIQKVRRGVILKLFSAVIMDTPVLTGRLRGNWQCSEGAPILDATENKDEDGGLTCAAMSNAVASSKPDTAIFLANNLPYAARIEYDGWSHTKAPEGMVRKNVARFNNIVAEVARE
jgi:hypothetical protein